MTTNTSHRDCTHPATPKDRAACRKARAAGTTITAISPDASVMIVEPVRKIVKIEWDREKCARCGGSGRYPSSMWDGVCLGCNGKGRKLTRVGRAAFKKYDAALRAGATVMAHELKPGDLIVNREGRRIMIHDVDTTVKQNGTTTIGTEGHDNYRHYKNYQMSYTTHRANGEHVVYYVDPRDEVLVWPSEDVLQGLFRLVENMKGAHVTYE
jgi:hypothetical protein